MAKLTGAQLNKQHCVCLMQRILNVFNTSMRENFTAQQHADARRGLMEEVSTLNTEKDRAACYNMIEACSRNMHQYHITMAYLYNGKVYPVQKNIPNCEENGTDYLHSLGLTMEQWSIMDRLSIWAHSGVVYQNIGKY